MSPAPPKGILVLPLSTLKAGAPALAHPSKWHGVVTLTLEEFTYAFVNTFSPEEAAAAYERALRLVSHDAERRYLERRLRQVRGEL